MAAVATQVLLSFTHQTFSNNFLSMVFCFRDLELFIQLLFWMVFPENLISRAKHGTEIFGLLFVFL